MAKKTQGAAAKKPRKPREKKGGAKAQNEQAAKTQATAPPRPSQGSATTATFKKPNKSQVVGLVKSLESLSAEQRRTSGMMGEKVAKAVENQHFDKTALGIARKLYRLATNDPAKFAITFPHLLAYCDDLELDTLADNARGLEINGEHGDSDGDGDEHEPTGGEVTGQQPGSAGSSVDVVDEAHDEQPPAGKSPGLTVVPRGQAPGTVAEQGAGNESPPSPTKAEAAA